MEEILLLRIGFNLEMRRLSRFSRSNLELPDVSIVKSAEICETESLFPVLDETPICFEIRVCVCRRV